MRESRKDKVIGVIASCFDLGPHAGHIATMWEAKKYCDYLIVALHVDPSSERETKNKPVQTIVERYIQAMSCRWVDEVVPYETESQLVDLLNIIRPDIRFIGEDYLGKDFTGKDLGIPIHYCSRKHSVSSSGLRRKIKG